MISTVYKFLTFIKTSIKAKRLSFHALIILGASILFFFFSSISLKLNAERFGREFYAQNYQNIEAGNGFELIPQLNALKSQSSIACIRGWVKTTSFFRSQSGCDSGLLHRDVLVSDRAQTLKISFRYILSSEILFYLFISYAILIAAANIMLLAIYRVEDIERKSILMINDLAREVAHDIRSPLSTLNSITYKLKDSNKDLAELITAVTKRINDIAEGLLSKSRSTRISAQPTINESCEVITTTSKLIDQKKIEFAHSLAAANLILRPITDTSEKFVTINASKLERILSNILNNSAEAISENGDIFVELFSDDNEVRLVVTDFGKGIAPEALTLLTKQEISNGKNKSGNGIGIFSAARELNAIGGKLLIDSKVGVGTRVTLEIPRLKN